MSEESKPRGDETGPVSASRPAMPRWVKVFVVIGLVLLVGLIVGLLTGHLGPGGGHAPRRHFGGAMSPDSDQHGARGTGGPAGPATATRTVEIGHYDAGMRGRITVG